MPDPNLHNPDPSLPLSGYGLVGLILIGMWEALKYGAKAIRFPRPKALDGSVTGRLDKLEAKQAAFEGQQNQLKLDIGSRFDRTDQSHTDLRSNFNTYRDIEFPSHANRIRSIEIAMREVQDRQNEMLEKLDSNGADQKDFQRTLRDLEGLMKQVQRALQQQSHP